jgi:acyl carrier protein
MTELKTVPTLEEVAETIKALVADVAGQAPEAIDDTTGLDTLGIDSLLVVEVVVGIQRRFGVQVPPSEFRADIRTVGDICQALGGFVHGQLSEAEAVPVRA